MGINELNHENHNTFVRSSALKVACLLYAKEPLETRTTCDENKNGLPSLALFPIAFFPQPPSSESTPQASHTVSFISTSNLKHTHTHTLTYTHYLKEGNVYA